MKMSWAALAVAWHLALTERAWRAAFGGVVECRPPAFRCRASWVVGNAGTPAYMAPELVMQSYSQECDVWSVGMLTYQLLTGRCVDFSCGGWAGRGVRVGCGRARLSAAHGQVRRCALLVELRAWQDQRAVL